MIKNKVLSTDLIKLDKGVLPDVIIQDWVGGIEVSRLLAASSFKNTFWDVTKNHLQLLLDKLDAGEVDGCNFSLDTSIVQVNRHGDFMAIIGADVVKDADVKQQANISFFNFCLAYGQVDFDAPFIVWMRAIRPGDKPETNAIARFFYEQIKLLLKR
jgi:hypothetical protein